MHGFPQTCLQTLCSTPCKNAWISTNMLTNPMFNCTQTCMDSHRHADKPYVQLHIKMHGFPQTCSQTLCSIACEKAWITLQTCSQKQRRTTQHSTKRPRAAPKHPPKATQNHPEQPRAAQHSETIDLHAFVCIFTTLWHSQAINGCVLPMFLNRPCIFYRFLPSI